MDGMMNDNQNWTLFEYLASNGVWILPFGLCVIPGIVQLEFIRVDDSVYFDKWYLRLS